MRRAHRTPGRVSLSLPASSGSVTLAETAARGLLQHRNGTIAATRLASASAELVSAGLARARPQDRLRMYYDVMPARIVVTVELRRRGRWQSGQPFRRSLTVGLEDHA